jgi:iron(III) transport system ATP-binding protein
LRLPLPGRDLPPGAADVVIRPEAVRIRAGSGAAGLRATVTQATYMGSHTEYNLTTSVGRLFAVSPDRLRRNAPGEVVDVGLDPEGVIVLRGSSTASRDKQVK